MISIYNIKPKFQAFLRPVLDLLHKMGVTANQITTGSLLLSLITGLLFWFADAHHLFFLALPIGLFLRIAFALSGCKICPCIHVRNRKNYAQRRWADCSL